MTAEVSHGRGGAGNINVDDTQYVDGAIVRTGAEGSHGDGAYSAGRGGAYTEILTMPMLHFPCSFLSVVHFLALLLLIFHHCAHSPSNNISQALVTLVILAPRQSPVQMWT